MKRRNRVIMLVIAVMVSMVFMPTTGLAVGSGVVTINSAWSGTLQQEVESSVNINGPTDVTELHITATDTLTDEDVNYINSMTSLEVLNVADSVTADLTVELNFLVNNDNLISVIFPATAISGGAFGNCDNLQSVTLSKVVTLGNASFVHCDNLANLNMPNVTTIGNDFLMFSSGANSIKTISLPKVQTFGDFAFSKCDNLESVNMPEATSFGEYAFESCVKLKSVTLPKVQSFEKGSFDRCTSLKEASFPELTSVGGGILSVCGITSLSAPKLDTIGGSWMFYDCTETIKLTLDSTPPSSVNADAFSNYDNEGKNAIIIVPEASIPVYDAAEGAVDDGKWYGWTITRPLTDAESVAADKANLELTFGGSDNAGSVTQDLTLDTSGSNGTAISWQTSDTNVVAADGSVARPTYTQGNKNITLTATISKGSESSDKTFTVAVKAQEPTDAESVTEDKANLELTFSGSDNAGCITQDLTLDASGGNGTAISWQSSDASVVAADGSVTRPTNAQGNKNITLTATISKGGESSVKTFTVMVKAQELTDGECVNADKANLELTFGGSDNAGSVTQDLALDTTGSNGTSISWQTSDTDVVAADGSVTRPTYTQGNKSITLTATISKGGESSSKIFTVTVKEQEATEVECVDEDKTNLELEFSGSDKAGSVTQDLTLDTSGSNGTAISWQSSDTSVVAADGSVTRPTYIQGNKSITLTATISKGGVSSSKTFTVTVKAQEPTDGECVDEDKANLELTFSGSDNAGSVMQDLPLITKGDCGSSITWVSSNTDIISAGGKVTRPDKDTSVSLAATIKKGNAIQTKSFTVTVKAKDVPTNTKIGNITGKLVDKDGEPLANYPVTLHSDPITVNTNSKGEFTFANVPLTEHTLIIKKKDGSVIDEYTLSFAQGNDTSYRIAGRTVSTTYTQDTVAVDVQINVNEGFTGSTIKTVNLIENPSTGDDVGIFRVLLILLLTISSLLIYMLCRSRYFKEQ